MRTSSLVRMQNSKLCLGLILSMIFFVSACSENQGKVLPQPAPPDVKTDVTMTAGPLKSAYLEGDVIQIRVTISNNKAARNLQWRIAQNQTPTNINLSSGTLQVGASESSAVIQIPTTNDSLYNPDQLVSVSIEDVAGQLTDATAQFNFANDEPMPFLSVADTSGIRGSVMIFRVSLNQPSSVAVNFRYATRDNTATAGQDYQATSGNVTIAAGETQTTIAVTAQSTLSNTADETFSLQLNQLSYAQAGDLTATGTILAGETLASQVGFKLGSMEVSESAGMVNAEVTLSQKVTRSVQLTLGVSGSAGPNKDFSIGSASVTIPAGTTSFMVPIAVVEDSIYEDTESIRLQITSSNGAAINQQASQMTITITDNDSPPLLSINDVVVVEGQSMKFTVTLDSVSGRDTLVTLKTRERTTQNGDFDSALTSFTIPAGQTFSEIVIATVDDQTFENSEDMEVAIVSASGAYILKGVGVGTIVDNDSSPQIQFSAAAQSALENAGDATVTVQLSQASGVPVRAEFSVGGTAQLGKDHNLASGVIDIPAGSTSADIKFKVFDDTVKQGSRSIAITFGQVTGAVKGANASVQIEIMDNE